MLTIYTIYDSPRDFPGWYVCRRTHVDKGGMKVEPISCLARDIEALRRPPWQAGLYQQPRYPDDDPVIIEVWF